MASPERHYEHPVAREPNPYSALARIYWMLFGYMILALLAAGIARSETSISLLDAGYWVVAATVVAVRSLDVARLQGTTADGEPATMAHWRRYAAALTLVAAAVWAGAHGVALFLGT